MDQSTLQHGFKNQKLLKKLTYWWAILIVVLGFLIGGLCPGRLFAQSHFKESVSRSRTIGVPNVTHFTEDDFKAGVQNWMICQDNLGILYFANTDGLLTYNGNDWRLYPLPNNTLVRSLAVGRDGKIYVGGQDEIGYYFPSENGSLLYHSLKSYLPVKQRSFSDVWNTGFMGGKVYFRCADQIYAVDTAAGKRSSVVYPSADGWLYMTTTAEEVLAQDKTKGLLRLKAGNWTLVTKAFNHQIITSILPLADQEYIISTLKSGLFILKGGSIRKIPIPPSIIDAHIYTATKINEREFALGTTSDGVFIIEKSGKLLRHYNSETNLQNNHVLHLFVDKEHNLWLGLDKGIDLVDYNSFIQTIRPVFNTPAACYTALIYKHELVIGTSDGLFKTPLTVPLNTDITLSSGRFSKVEGSTGQVWGLYNTGDHLIMGHNDGSFLVEGNKALPIDPKTGVWLFQPVNRPAAGHRRWVSGTYDGLTFLDDTLGSLRTSGYLEESPKESLRFVEIDSVRHVIWASHPYRGIYGIQMSQDMRAVLSVRLYTQKDGLPRTLNNYVYPINGKNIFCTEQGIYTYDPSMDRFIPDPDYQKIFGNIPIRLVREDQQGRIWFVTGRKLGVYIPGQTVKYFPELTGKLISGFEFILPINNKNVLVGTNDGLVHINVDKYQRQQGPAQVLITRVSTIGTKDSILFNGYFTDHHSVVKAQSPERVRRLPATFNSIHFEFTTTSFRPPREFEYSYKLEGFDKQWSAWNPKKEKDYTNLSYGTYRILVKARDRFGMESKILPYQFVIKPYWYQSTLAYLVYMLLFLALVIYGKYLFEKKFEAQQVKFEEKQAHMRYLHQLEMEHSEKEIIQLQKEKLEAEVVFKNQELASTTMHLFKRGKLLSKLKEQLSLAIKKLPRDTQHEDLIKLVKMLSEAEKQDADWEQFAIHFDQVHNNFLANLKQIYPALTPSDIKVCAYIKMNLSSKEIAQLLNISVKGVEVARYRLRKKLGINDAQVNLFDFISEVKPATKP